MIRRNGTDETEIKSLIESWAGAVRRHDLPAVLAHHERDIVMFDLPPPLQCRGLDAYSQTWDLFFKYHRPGQAFDVEEIDLVCGEDVAFAAAIMRCGSEDNDPAKSAGFLFRLTVGLRKVEGDWRVVHEHHSEPATN